MSKQEEVDETVEENEEVLEEEQDDSQEEEDSGLSMDDFSLEDIVNMQAALKKANKEAKKYRLERNELRTELETEDERRVREAKEEAANEVRSKFVNRLVQAEARVKLAVEGVENPDRLLRLINTDDVEVDNDGNVENIDEVIEGLKEDFPEFFEGGKPAPNVDRGDKKPSTKAMSSAERLAKMANSKR